MSKNHPTDNIYTILGKLDALTPAVPTAPIPTQKIYESIDAKGSILAGVDKIERKLSEQFTADKKALDTNPKNDKWDAAALTQQRSRLAREKNKLADQERRKHQHPDHVAEGWDDMIKAAKERDAVKGTTKKKTSTGTVHHGKYGTEYQGDRDEEEAADAAAEKGVKKRGRPIKHLARHKAKQAGTTGEKKGRGRPKKSTTDTDTKYSGSKSLQDYVVGNIPAGKKARGRVHSLKETRIVDESGQTLDHILNRFKHEVREFENNNELDDDLYHALYDYYLDSGDMPYGVAKARTGDPYEWVSENLYSHLKGGNVVDGNDFDAGDYGMERESVLPNTNELDELDSLNPMGVHKELDELAALAGINRPMAEDSKPDYIDIDHDGDKTEPMKSAARDVTDESTDGTCATCNHQPCQCDEGNAFGKAVRAAKADGIQSGEKVRVGDKEYPVREAEEMISMMKNAGLDTSRAEAALDEARAYGDTEVDEPPHHDNTPEPEYHSVKSVIRRGNDLNREKKQFAGKPKTGDNPMASESVDPLEAMGRRLMQAYESIKVTK